MHRSVKPAGKAPGEILNAKVVGFDIVPRRPHRLRGLLTPSCQHRRLLIYSPRTLTVRICAKIVYITHPDSLPNSSYIMTNQPTVNPSEVGWQFVPQYYTFVNKQPNRLHCFYTKASTFIHGTEGEDGKPCYGQQVRILPSHGEAGRAFAGYAFVPVGASYTRFRMR